MCLEDGKKKHPPPKKNTPIFHKQQSESWKQNKGQYRSKVDHRGWCSQRLVTKILTPLWNCLQHKCGMEIIPAMMNPFSISIFDPSPPLYVPHEIQ